MRVLYVEDAPSDADLTVRELARSAPDIQFEIAGSIAEALALLAGFEASAGRGEQCRFDLVLLDLNLPDGNGLSVLAEVRHRALPLAVVVLTGSGDEQSVLSALRAGADDYLPKRNEYWTELVATLRSAHSRFHSLEIRRRRPLNLLYAEPNERDVNLTRLHLAARAPFIRVDVVDSAEQILARLPRSGPVESVDVVLLDYRLPGMNALETLKEIFQIRGLDVPVILTTGHSTEEIALQALKLGAMDYIVKSPGYLNHLAPMVENAFHRSIAAREHAALLRQEQELRESEERFRAFQDSSPVSASIVDAQGRITYANRTYLANLGKPADQVIGRTLSELFPAHHAREFLAANARVLEGGIIEENVETLPFPNGTIHTMSTHRFPVIDVHGDRSVGGIALNITERIRAEESLRISQERFEVIVRATNDVIWDWDLVQNTIWWNDNFFSIGGYRREEVEPTAESWTGRIHPDDRDRVLAGIRAVIDGDGQMWSDEYRFRRADGSFVAIFDRGFVVRDEQGKGRRMLGAMQDVTKRKEQEQKIARQSRIHAVLSGINSAIVRIRDRKELFNEACRIAVEHGRFNIGRIAVLDHASGKLVLVAQAGLPLDSGAGRDSADGPIALVPAGAAEIALREKRHAFDNDIEHDRGVARAAAGPDTMDVRRAAIQMGAKSVIVLPLFVEGETFGVLTLYAPERNFFDDEEIKLLNELAGDISFGLEFIAKEEKVDYLAYYDTLTELPNRSLFFDRLAHQIGTSARDHTSVALVLIDLDRFRHINDTLGRQAGDALLEAVAGRLRDTVRDQDSVARVGANRFALAVSGLSGSAEAARALESRNRQCFERTFSVGDEELRISATAGIAMFPADADNAEALFANAEAALRRAKTQSVRFLFYGPEMNARVAESLRLETKLRRAIENEELVLWYQPKIDLISRKLTGFEALMRWQDPETGLVPPGHFIPLMEQTGLILDAGGWALNQVARDCWRWGAEGATPPRVAVNVSPIQLRQRNFVDSVVVASTKTQEAGSTLDIEITESVLMENVEAIIPKLQTISRLGVETAVDDFGTGYSSLAYIARLPIHALKIDRSFIVGMTQSEESLAIVRSVISLAHSLRLKVIAEGVETEEQSELLMALGCDEAQGYLLSPPVPPDQVPAIRRKFS